MSAAMKSVNTGVQLSAPGQRVAGAYLQAFIESRGFNLGITAVIVINPLRCGIGLATCVWRPSPSKTY
jgi:hypothetical protein